MSIKIIQVWQCYYGRISEFYGSESCICSNDLGWNNPINNDTLSQSASSCKLRKNLWVLPCCARQISRKQRWFRNIATGIPGLGLCHDLVLLLVLHFLSLSWRSVGADCTHTYCTVYDACTQPHTHAVKHTSLDRNTHSCTVSLRCTAHTHTFRNVHKHTELLGPSVCRAPATLSY